jgi:hypothetical protein
VPGAIELTEETMTSCGRPPSTEPGPATDSLFRFDGLEQQTYLTDRDRSSIHLA